MMTLTVILLLFRNMDQSIHAIIFCMKFRSFCIYTKACLPESIVGCWSFFRFISPNSFCSLNAVAINGEISFGNSGTYFCNWLMPIYISIKLSSSKIIPFKCESIPILLYPYCATDDNSTFPKLALLP